MGTATLQVVVCATGIKPLRSVELRLARYDTSGQRAVSSTQTEVSAWQPAVITAGAGTHRIICHLENISGGLYSVQARANDSLSTEIDLGVGEVFALAGQSNASGAVNCGELPTRHTRFVQYFNEKYACQAHDPGGRGLPGGSDSCSGPTKGFRFYWGALSDLLVEHLGVPVVFHQTAYSGSQIDDWAKGSQGLTTRLGPAVPYGSLLAVLTKVAPQTGLRAVLWLQGESDQQTPLYDATLDRLIGKSREDAGFNVPWVVAQTSLYDGDTSPELVQAQVRVIGYANHTRKDTTGGVKSYGDPFPGPFGRVGVFSGPFTDSLGSAFRCDNTHFGKTGQERLAQAWFEALTQPYDAPGPGGTFLTNSLPLLAQRVPDVACPPSSVAEVIPVVTQLFPATSDSNGAGAVAVEPNPSADWFRVRVTLGQPGPLRLRVFSLTGVSLADEWFEGQSGKNHLNWDARALPVGLYALRIDGLDGQSRVVRVLKTDR
ncbi:MAG: hypothetical protein H7Y12_11790 [Sphingobacteriaceae bacterium]|nr:hypothetical protein [Cytophagaceae bacterium]